MEQKRARDLESQVEMTKSSKLARASSATENKLSNGEVSKPTESPKSPAAKKSSLPLPEPTGRTNLASAATVIATKSCLHELSSQASQISSNFPRQAACSPSRGKKNHIGLRARFLGARTPSPIKKPCIYNDGEFSPEVRAVWDYDQARRDRLMQNQGIQLTREDLRILLRGAIDDSIKLNTSLEDKIFQIIKSSKALLSKNTQSIVITEDLLGVLSLGSLQQLLEVINDHHEEFRSLEKALLSFGIEMIADQKLLKLREDFIVNIANEIKKSNKYYELVKNAIKSYCEKGLGVLLRETLRGCVKANTDLAQAISLIVASSMALLPKNINNSIITPDLLGVLSGASLQQLRHEAERHHRVLLLLEEKLLAFEVYRGSSQALLGLKGEVLESIKMDIQTAARYENLLIDVIDSYHRDMQVSCNYFHLDEPYSEKEIIGTLERYLKFPPDFLEKRPTLVRMLIEKTSSYSSKLSHKRMCLGPEADQIRQSLLNVASLYEREELARQQAEQPLSLSMARVF